MSKAQNAVLNYCAVAVTIISYIVTRVYNDFQYLQVVQRSFLIVMFLAGLTMIINNFLYIKQTRKKFLSIFFICLGVIIAVYTGFTLYLILALQNTGF